MGTTKMSGIHLIYQYFRVRPRPEQGFNDLQASNRQTEYDECLQRNLLHPQIQGLHILLEDAEEETSLRLAISLLPETCREKLTIQHLGRRMLYSDAFDYANQHLVGSICVILNADIFLGDFQITVDKTLFPEKSCWSLTRHEKSTCLYLKKSPPKQQDLACGCPFLRGKRNYYGSHDSFWFVSPIVQGVLENCQHVQNRWGAEHKVINELLRHGYHIGNPSRTMRTFHNHDSDVHPWRKEPGGEQVLADPRDHPPLPPTHL